MLSITKHGKMSSKLARVNPLQTTIRQKMNFQWCVFLYGLIFCSNASFAETAEWLIRFEKKSGRFRLDEDALSKIFHLKGPIKVITAIGDARIGKSTTLNAVVHKWKSDSSHEANIGEAFQTGDSALPETHGVWMSIFQNSEKENIVFLDVERTNIGNKPTREHLSIFTTWMSSGIVIFCSETVNNGILDFLYRLPRLSEFIFKGTDKIKYSFGHLHVVIRGALKQPNTVSLEERVRDFITKSSGGDVRTDEKRKLIGKYFRREDITVNEIPLIQSDHSLFTNSFQIRNHTEYWDAIKVLAQRFQDSAVKTTLLGCHVNGSVLAKLAKTLVEMINKDIWTGLGVTNLSAERCFCDESYDTFVAPFVALETSPEVEDKKESILEAFKDHCAFPEQVEKAKDGLVKLIQRHKTTQETEIQRIEADRKRKEAEEKKHIAEKNQREADGRMIEAERRRKEAEEMEKIAERKQNEAFVREIEAKRRREEAERGQRIAKEKVRQAERNKKEAEKRQKDAETARKEAEMRRLKAVRKRIEAVETLRQMEQRSRKKKKGSDFVSVVGTCAALVGILSDARLKQIITILRPSKYEVLGLREVVWVWNKHAQRLGLSGAARGVIAQEVEQLYPWAVLTGHDGYKRVNYAALDDVVVLAINKHSKQKLWLYL